jgi:prepilin-type N-terminal cleavage/methylation domain-containing protein
MRHKGMTLVELIVALAITSVILASAGRVMLISQEAIRIGAVEADLSHQATSICDRVANDLKDGLGTIDPTQNDPDAPPCSGVTVKQTANSKVTFTKNPTYERDAADGKYKKHTSEVTYELIHDTRTGKTFWYIQRTETRDGGTPATEVLTDCATKAGFIVNKMEDGKTFSVSVQLLRKVRYDDTVDGESTDTTTSDSWEINQNSLDYFMVLRSTAVHVNF